MIERKLKYGNWEKRLTNFTIISRKYLLLFGLASVLSFNACAQKKVESGAYNTMLKILLKHDVPEIGAAEAYKNAVEYIFLDSRERKEFNVSHISGAVWIGYDDFEITQVKRIPKNKKIIVYCSVGARSEKISDKLIANGFKDVSNMYGGIFEWVNRNYPVYTNQNKPTKKVHAYNRGWGIWLRNAEKVY
ncbi:MAG: rhodanese-like domain-containing protein [Daejeonella sp.]